MFNANEFIKCDSAGKAIYLQIDMSVIIVDTL